MFWGLPASSTIRRNRTLCDDALPGASAGVFRLESRLPHGGARPPATVAEAHVGSVTMATFVIVHGAWGGAWSWNKFVVPMLRAAGQTVHPVTLTGLGERSHLASPEVSLDTHIQDVCNVLFYEDLTDVLLVGHSYGGNVITGVADRVPERLQQLVYLDAATPADGQSSADSFPGRREQLEEQARQSGAGWQIAPGAVPA